MNLAHQRGLKMVLGITGASGSVYAQLLLEKLDKLGPQVEACDVVFSDCGKDVWHYELGKKSFEAIKRKIYAKDDFYAPFASGSSGYDLMIICPCTMGTLGRIAGGISNDLITRCADVMLKEKKKLILVTREMPLNLIHINNMKLVSEAGAIVCPASPSFYGNERKTDEILSTVVYKVLNLAGFSFDNYEWGSAQQKDKS